MDCLLCLEAMDPAMALSRLDMDIRVWLCERMPCAEDARRVAVCRCGLLVCVVPQLMYDDMLARDRPVAREVLRPPPSVGLNSSESSTPAVSASRSAPVLSSKYVRALLHVSCL